MPPESETGVDSPPPAENGTVRGVGSLLHASRLRCGEDLAGISQILKVRLPYLEAIEEGRFGDLPGNTYAIGFIRAYADYLGLDSGEVIRRYKEDVADANKKSDLDFPVPVPESGIPGGAVLFIGAVIAILTYGAWYASTTKSGFFAELISPVPEKLGLLSPKAEKSVVEKKVNSPTTEETTEEATEKDNPAPPQTTDEQSPAAVAAVADAAEGPETEKATVAALKPEPEETAPSLTPKPEPKPKTDTVTAKTAKTAKTVEAAKTTKTPETPPPVVMESASAPASPIPEAVSTQTPREDKIAKRPEPKPQKVAEKPHPEAVTVSTAAGEAPKSVSDSGRIVIRAKANSWIQIRDGIGNKLLVTRLLRSGDSYRVPDKPGLKLLTGNAGALEVLIDGKEAPAIGGKGAVRRSVMLDVDRLLQGTAVIE